MLYDEIGVVEAKEGDGRKGYRQAGAMAHAGKETARG